jgi:hypothetical protein
MSTSTDTTATSSVTTNVSVSGETLQFRNNEKDILAYWKQINAFETSNKLSKDRPKYEQKNFKLMKKKHKFSY